MDKRIRLPNALVIGAPKSGTTSLFFYLKQHPDIFLPSKKELHYFSYDLLARDSNGPGDKKALSTLCATKQDYESYYGAVKEESVIMEISPSYLYFCQVSERIRSELGKVKIVVLLRNPVKRAFSQYMHLVQRGRETLNFYEALMVETERREAGWGDMWRYAESSLYADRVKKYISVFGRSNVKITLTEDFIRNTDGVMRGLFDFLEVETDFCADTSKVYNKSGVPKSELVNNLLSRPSKLRTIMKFLVPKPLRSRIRVSLSALNLDKGKMDEKSEAHLISYFYADIIKLEQIIGRRTGWIQDTK